MSVTCTNFAERWSECRTWKVANRVQMQLACLFATNMWCLNCEDSMIIPIHTSLVYLSAWLNTWFVAWYKILFFLFDRQLDSGTSCQADRQSFWGILSVGLGVDASQVIVVDRNPQIHEVQVMVKVRDQRRWKSLKGRQVDRHTDRSDRMLSYVRYSPY
jgi:hypothetical protein